MKHEATKIHDGSSVRLERITPEMANDWIDTQRHRRPVRQHRVVEFAEAMKSGRWIGTASMIQFDRTGALIDGQHRLYAIIESGVPISNLVLRGAEPNTVDVIDIGSARTIGDQLRMRNVERYSEFAAVGTLIYGRERHGQLNETLMLSSAFRRRIPTEELDAFIASHQRIIEVLRPAALIRAASGGIVPVSVLGYLIYQTDASIPPLEAACSGIGLAVGEPAYALHRYLRGFGRAIGKDRVTRFRLLSVCSKTINATIRGETVSALKVSDRIEDIIGGCWHSTIADAHRSVVGESAPRGNAAIRQNLRAVKR